MFCEGKKPYRSHAEAAIAAKHIRRNEAEKVREFWCQACKCWHVGHAPETRRLRDSDFDGEEDDEWLDYRRATWYH